MKKIILIFLIFLSLGSKTLSQDLDSLRKDSLIENNKILPKSDIEEDYKTMESAPALMKECAEPILQSNQAVSQVATPTMNSNKSVQHSQNNKLNKNIVENTGYGKFIYYVPDTMRVLNSYIVNAKISRYFLSRDIKSEIDIKISNKMEVKLIDPTNESFIIVNITNNDQFIDDSTYTEWSWNVKPLKTGELPLKVVVSIFKNDIAKETVYTEIVKIKTDVKKEADSFFESYWQWIISTLILPFVIWFFNKQRKKN